MSINDEFDHNNQVTQETTENINDENNENNENNENMEEENSALIPEKKKRGRKRKEDLLNADIEEQKKLTLLSNKNQELELDASYYVDRNKYDYIVLAAFLTRYRNIKDPNIKDNDNIIRDGIRILDEVKSMSDAEYALNYRLFLRHLNGEDIFE